MGKQAKKPSNVVIPDNKRNKEVYTPKGKFVLNESLSKKDVEYLISLNIPIELGEEKESNN